MLKHSNIMSIIKQYFSFFMDKRRKTWYNECKAFILFYLNALADTQIGQLYHSASLMWYNQCKAFIESVPKA